MVRNSLAALAAAAVIAASSVTATGAAAETRVTFKAAKSGTSYYQMSVQIAEAVKAGTDGGIIVTVEESQGSVQNVKEAANRSGNYVFTTPPALAQAAMAGKGQFEPKDPAFDKLRSLFPIPFLTMHYVVRADSGISGFADLDGKSFIIGKGSFGASEAEKNFETFGVAGKVKLVDVELGSAVSALKNGQVDGFATAGSYPAPNVIEAAAGTEVRLLSMTDEQVAATKRTKLVIPAGTYPGIDSDTVTTSLPVGAYTTSDMDEDTAYQMTKAYWERKAAMAQDNPWWGGVSPAMLETLGAPLHPGAVKYYKEAGFEIPGGLM